MTKVDDQVSALMQALDSANEKIATMQPEVVKISGESSTTLALLKEMQTSGGLSPETSQKLDAAVAKAQSVDSSLANLAASIKSVDDLVEDKPVEQPAPNEPAPAAADPADGAPPTAAPEAPPVAGTEQTS